MAKMKESIAAMKLSESDTQRILGANAQKLYAIS
jgi:hypothetical protein